MVQNRADMSTGKPNGESEDLRVRRTRKLIQQAFIELTVERGFSELTVQDIADRAMINRSTFYRHYLDKYDLLERYMEGVYEATSDEEFLADKLQPQPDGVPKGLLNLLKHIQAHSAFYRVMLGPKGCPQFVQQLRQHTERRFQTLLANIPTPSDPDSPPLDLRISYISHAGVGAIQWWVDHQEACTPEQLARWFSQLSSASAGIRFDEYLHIANTVHDSGA